MSGAAIHSQFFAKRRSRLVRLPILRDWPLLQTFPAQLKRRPSAEVLVRYRAFNTKQFFDGSRGPLFKQASPSCDALVCVLPNRRTRKVYHLVIFRMSSLVASFPRLRPYLSQKSTKSSSDTRVTTRSAS